MPDLMMALLQRLRNDDRGFTLIELMVGMVLGGIVLTALMTIFVHGLQGTNQVTDRVYSAQNGRITLDRMTQLLQAQTCLASSAPISAATATSVTFTATLGTADADPEKYTLTFNPTARTITEYQYDPIDAADGTVTYAATPSRSAVRGTNVVQNGTAPIFNYFKFDATGEPAVLSPVPLSVSNQQQVVRVDVNFTTLPPRVTAATDLRSADMAGTAIVSSADSSQPNKGPNC